MLAEVMVEVSEVAPPSPEADDDEADEAAEAQAEAEHEAEVRALEFSQLDSTSLGELEAEAAAELDAEDKEAVADAEAVAEFETAHVDAAADMAAAAAADEGAAFLEAFWPHHVMHARLGSLTPAAQPAKGAGDSEAAPPSTPVADIVADVAPSPPTFEVRS